MNSHRLRLIWVFYKSTLLINLGCSLATPFINYPEFIPFFKEMIIFSFMTGGLCIAIVYKEFVRPQEYYFYYNCSLSKITLIGGCFVINSTIGSLLLLLALNV